MNRRSDAAPVSRHPSQLTFGLGGLAMWRHLDTARIYGWLLAVGYGAVLVYGLVAAGNSDINFLSINGADNDLHLASSLAGFAIAHWPTRRPARDFSGRGA